MMRTMIIWFFSNYIIPPFYKDYWSLLLAFAVILAGRCIYNDIFFGNIFLYFYYYLNVFFRRFYIEDENKEGPDLNIEDLRHQISV